MLLNEYNNRLWFELGDAVATTVVRGHVAWVVVQGTDGQAIGVGHTQIAMSGLVGQVAVGKTVDAGLEATDPARMKKVTDMLLRNSDSVSHDLLIYVDHGGYLTKAWVGTIPAGGALGYSNGVFDIYNAAGVRGVAGPAGATGATGATGSTGAAGTTGTATTVEVNIGTTPRWSGVFTLTDAAITAVKKVLVWQAPGPYTGKGTLADEAVMQPVNVVTVAPAAGSALVYWETPPLVTVSAVSTMSLTAGGGTFANNGNNPDLQFVARRLGKVRGNLKFSYLVLT